MQSWASIEKNLAKNIKVVFADIDDTISSEGKILPQAYNALWQLNNAGISVVPITGRCAGWVDHIARMWPVKGVVGENGAFYAFMDNKEAPSKLKKRYFLQPDEVKESKLKFKDIQRDVFTRFPTSKLASDQPYREFDLAIDFCEDVPPLSMTDVQEIVKIYESYGANTKVSSIHVNGWFGDYDKLTMTKIFAQEVLGFSIEDHPEWAVFIGDSPNDQPMFEFFPNSVGVYNVTKFLSMLEHPPKFLTENEGGLGFAEMVEILIKLRE
jgi:HAD superfamily hydrolase (TIGR01484 family)